jgi:hypothetical protein
MCARRHANESRIPDLILSEHKLRIPATQAFHKNVYPRGGIRTIYLWQEQIGRMDGTKHVL